MERDSFCLQPAISVIKHSIIEADGLKYVNFLLQDKFSVRRGMQGLGSACR